MTKLFATGGKQYEAKQSKAKQSKSQRTSFTEPCEKAEDMGETKDVSADVQTERVKKEVQGEVSVWACDNRSIEPLSPPTNNANNNGKPVCLSRYSAKGSSAVCSALIGKIA